MARTTCRAPPTRAHSDAPDQVGGEPGNPRAVRGQMGREAAASAARPWSRSWTSIPTRSRAHRGREPGDVGPVWITPASAGASRSRRAGSVPTETAVYADVMPASAWPEKDGTVTSTNRQVQMGRQAVAAGRHAPRFVDHPGDRQPHGLRLDLQARQRGVHRDGLMMPALTISPGSASSASTPSPIRPTGRIFRP